MAQTIHGQVAAARELLRAAGIDPIEAKIDARLLAQHLLDWDSAQYFSALGDRAPTGFTDRYMRLVARRAAREPLAYIVRHQEFWGLELLVTPSVLIPRPETELIVEGVLEIFTNHSMPLAIVDVCAGCGCLAVALAVEYPRARVLATDVSRAALEVARQNIERHRVSDRVTLLETDLLLDVSGTHDLIVSNPPYVPDGDRVSMQPEVRNHEPSVALFGGIDGLSVIRRLAPSASALLRPGGQLLFEFGVGQSNAVLELISRTPGLTMNQLKQDLQGIPRTAIAERIKDPA